MVGQREGVHEKSADDEIADGAPARKMGNVVPLARRQRFKLRNPVGLLFLAASLLVGAALAVVPALEPWAGRAGLVVGWGIVVHLAAVLVAAWTGSTRASESVVVADPGAVEAPPPRAPNADPVPVETQRTVRGPYPDGLTRREVEVLCLLAAGKANKEIAAQLSLSVPTAERHVANIYTKIDAHGRVEAAAYALGHRLCPPPVRRPPSH
jgi:DNA-binding CsgD family transcriptional regulator